MYEFVKKTAQLYRTLQDEVSKNIFWARLQYDVEPTMTNSMGLARCYVSQDDWERHKDWKKKLQAAKGKLILYGTSFTGQQVAASLQQEKLDFYGFCGRRAESFPNGLMGKPVISPSYLFDHADEFFVLIAAADTAPEIFATLKKHGYPQDHILAYFQASAKHPQYFEFPSLYPKGTAFIDGGCFDGEDSLRFAEYCQGQYSAILALEPDPTNYRNCQQSAQLKQLRDFRLLQAGLSDSTGTAEFSARESRSSCMTRSAVDSTMEGIRSTQEIQTVTIDDLAAGQRIGFIKMDIEGVELDALHGARHTIERDKPLLAICVDHRPGDTLAIMDYLQQVMPKYRFWLRHYSAGAGETVLYAAVPVED